MMLAGMNDIVGAMAGKSRVDVSEAAAVLAKLGGRARADSLTAERRKEIAEKAARTRWGKAKPKRRAPKS